MDVQNRYTPRAKLFTDHVNIKTNKAKTGRNWLRLLMSQRQPCDSRVTLLFSQTKVKLWQQQEARSVGLTLLYLSLGSCQRSA